MPESIERRTGSLSALARPEITILGPPTLDGLAFDELLRALFRLPPFLLLTAFFCLGMALLQQRRDGFQKLFNLDGFIQHCNIIVSCVLRSFGAGIPGQEYSGNACMALAGGVNNFEAGAL